MIKKNLPVVFFIALIVFPLTTFKVTAQTEVRSNTPLQLLSEDLSSTLSGEDQPHWWVGAEAPPDSAHGRSISTDIHVPSSLPYGDDDYSAVLSAFDSYGSYDQVGINTDNSIWVIIYSTSTWDYNNNWDVHTVVTDTAVSLGTTYTFCITVQNNVTTFQVSSGGTVVWSQDIVTGGQYLYCQRYYSRGGKLYESYTVYEEAQKLHFHDYVPPYNFDFTNQQWVGIDGSVHTPTWTAFSFANHPEVFPAPSMITVLIDGGNVKVVNQPIDITVLDLEPIPPHYSIFQVYHHGMRINGQPISMTYSATIGRTDSTTVLLALVRVDLIRTDEYGDYRVLNTQYAVIMNGDTVSLQLVWDETNTADPQTLSISAKTTLEMPENAWDTNTSNDQLTNDTVQAVFLVGDVNGDGIVDIFDAILLSGTYGKLEGQSGYNPDANFGHNADPETGLQIIDILDAIDLGRYFSWTIYGPPGKMSLSEGGGSGLAATGTTSVFLDPSQIMVFKGEVFSVNVNIASVTCLSGWEFKLYWNSTILNCTNYVLQNPAEWQDSTQDFGTGIENAYNATNGRFWKAEAATYPAPAFTGSLTIATLTFQAMQPGTTSLTLTETKLGNSTGDPIDHTELGSQVNVYSGRYMRSDTQQINGLSAYKLGIPQSTSSAVDTHSGSGAGAEWGIRAWIRHSNGVEQEISLDGQTGTPEATVGGGFAGIKSSTVSVAQTALQSTDSLVIRVYVQIADGPWNLCAPFTTERLQSNTLKATTWTVYYYTSSTYNRVTDRTTAKFYWGTTTYNSRIQNLQYT